MEDWSVNGGRGDGSEETKLCWNMCKDVTIHTVSPINS